MTGEDNMLDLLWLGLGGGLVSGLVLSRADQFWMRISTTTLANLMSMMAATVSSSGLSRVGPKQTARLATVIRFLSHLTTTLAR